MIPTRQRAFEQFKLEPNVVLELHDAETKELVFRQKSRNLVVTTGVELVRDLLGGTGHRPSHIELGTGVTAVAAADGATYGGTVETPAYRDLITRREDLALAIEFQLFLAQNDGNGFTYTEAGILETGFQNSAAGDPAILFARTVFTGIAKTISVELTLTWTINIAAV